MKTTLHMLEKEWLEDRMVVIAPLVLFVCAALIAVAMLSNSDHFSYQFSYTSNGSMATFPGFELSLTNMLIAIAGVVSIAMSSTYFPKTLLRERQEGSWMFWRSMPVTDLHRHLIKLLFGLLVIPFMCSLFVLAAEVLFWLVKVFSNQGYGILLGPLSFSHIVLGWFEFLARMILVAIALLPMAAISLAVSQKTRSPIITMFVGIYVVKLMPIILFGYYGVSQFVSTVIDLSSEALLDANPLSGFLHANLMYLVLYFALGAIGLVASLRYSKTIQ
ncbi:hypothetical protein M9194_09685 [Vibrio sp. S4M6]|uniref:hypothetical protein n=1 Tax=Vibrio sinus TaxID=2946865 RepID=UPI00202A3556|nr:hypothetical protein [Vibrio sinus]MCL9781695.1 hypothetical protein [Vibrio sinus]